MVHTIGDGSRCVLCTELGTHPFWPAPGAPWETSPGPHPFWPSPQAPLAPWTTIRPFSQLGTSHTAAMIGQGASLFVAALFPDARTEKDTYQKDSALPRARPSSLRPLLVPSSFEPFAPFLSPVDSSPWPQPSPVPLLLLPVPRPSPVPLLLLPVPPSLSSSLPSASSPRSRARPRGDLATSREEPR